MNLQSAKPIFRILIAGLAACCLLCPIQAKPEYRALWVDSWNPGMTDPGSCKLMVSRARQHNFNTLFVEVCKTMDAYYKSKILPAGTGINPPGFDPLLATLRHAKPKDPKIRNLDVHAWVVALRAWKDKPYPQKEMVPKHVMRKHPDWLSKDSKGRKFGDSNYFLDPGHPGVQDFVVSICTEIVRKYKNLDGLHLDYIRYPGNTWGYNEVALKRFREESGRKGKPAPEDPEWSAWRRQQVNHLVRRIATEVKAINPGIKLSAATITWGGVPEGDFKKTRAYNDALQNWIGWVDAGYLDMNVPMIYKRGSKSSQAQDFVDWVNLARKSNPHRHFITGLGAWLNPLKTTIRQGKVARQHKADGVCFFSYNQMESKDRPSPYAMRDLSGGFFSDVVPVPPAPWVGKPATGTAAGRDPQRRNAHPVLLLNDQGQKVARIRTDANGYFSFFGVRPGQWRVQIGTASLLSKPIRITPGKVSRAVF